MTKLTTNDKHIINSLVQDHLLDKILDEAIADIALDIVNTEIEEDDIRFNLYLLTKALKEVKGKLQGYVNEFDNQED
jgi:hypothetical protein